MTADQLVEEALHAWQEAQPGRWFTEDHEDGFRAGWAAHASPELLAVAHAAWHLLDDGGESPDDLGLFLGTMVASDRLSAALDALEATGWNAHPDEVPS